MRLSLRKWGATEADKEEIRNKKLAQLQKALENTVEYQERVKKRVETINSQAIAVGRRHQQIRSKEDDLELSKKLYDRVSERIKQMEMESKRPARVSVAYNASSAMLPNKRMKMVAAVIFASLAAGVFLAFLRAKADRSLHTPDDITKLLNLPIIGTTMTLDGLAKNALDEYILHDYQTIRANLRLLNDGAIPRTMAIGSAGPREGKTTFAINLATSLAQSGHRVLVIDGDFRKPDLTRLLGFNEGTKGFSDVVSGRSRLEDTVCTMSRSNLHALRGSNGSPVDPVELLSRPEAAELLKAIAEEYDHVIIDTPPILAAPESLLWAKMVDAVILTSYAGVTPGPALREAIEKLAQIKVNVLGNVLSSFRPQSGSGRYYYYGDYTSGAYGKSSKRKNEALCLPPGEKVHPIHADRSESASAESASTGSGGATIQDYPDNASSRRRRGENTTS